MIIFRDNNIIVKMSEDRRDALMYHKSQYSYKADKGFQYFDRLPLLVKYLDPRDWNWDNPITWGEYFRDYCS